MSKKLLILLVAIVLTFCISFMDYGNNIIGLSGMFGMLLLPISVLAAIWHLVEILAKKKSANYMILALPLALFLGFSVGDYAIVKQDIKNQMRFYELENTIEKYRKETGKLPKTLSALGDKNTIKQERGFSSEAFSYRQEDSLHFVIKYFDNNGYEISFSSKTGEITSTPFSL